MLIRPTSSLVSTAHTGVQTFHNMGIGADSKLLSPYLIVDLESDEEASKVSPPPGYRLRAIKLDEAQQFSKKIDLKNS